MIEDQHKLIGRYIAALKLEGEEMANRTAFENLLKEINASMEAGCLVVQDTSSEENRSNRIDFIIKNEGSEIAYAETKKIHDSTADLEKLLQSDQIARYRKHGHPLLFTNYIDFIYIDKNYTSPTLSIARIDGQKIKSTKEHKENYGKLLNWLTALFNASPSPISKVAVLARRLALATQQLRGNIEAQLAVPDSPISKAYENFKALIGAMSSKDFASAYAETIAYGLIMIRLRSEGQDISVGDLISKESLPIISDLAIAIRNSQGEVANTIDAIIRIANLIDRDALQKELAYKTGSEKDPYIYLYEDFLQAYDPQIRKDRGVYYTPLPVVQYIVRSVNWVLQTKLDIRKGLKDSGVKILDFATGTGTFLLEAIRLVLKEESPSASAQLVHEHILKNFYGFEYLMAPYAVAHLKTAQTLHEMAGIYASPQILLTNTLQNFDPPEFSSTILVELEKEGKKAHAVKNKEQILAIIGNPPYSGHSANTEVHVNWRDTEMGDSYFMCDGKPLGEKNSKWLNDDYVKFIRFAQWKINKVDKGVVALITNHGFLDNPTFRGMRQSLMNTFDECYFLDLHGNSKRKETAPDGGKDENVFPIQQGVAILIMIKNKALPKQIYAADLYGKQNQKFNTLENNTIESTKWAKLQPDASVKYVLKDIKYPASKLMRIGLDEIFLKNSVGTVTSRDHFAIGFTQEEIEKRLVDFCNPKISNEEIADRYQLEDTKAWKIDRARKKTMYLSLENRKELIHLVDYRVFDRRYIFYDNSIIERPRNFLQNMLYKNIALISNSATFSGQDHTFISKLLIDFHFSGSSTYAFPLYLYENPMFPDQPVPNLQPAALKQIAAHYGQEPSPEALFYYIYAVLHYPAYRRDFAGLLRIDFPQIPFVAQWEVFARLSALGERLAQAHLLESFGTHQSRHCPDGGLQAQAPRYENGRLYYNAASYFDNVPADIWELHIGGYQVLKAWLDSRKGRALTIAESQKMEDIICALVHARGIVEEIEAVGL